MIVLKFHNFEEKYDSKFFRCKFNKKTKLVKVINKKTGLTELFRFKKYEKVNRDIVFTIQTLIKTGVRS